MLFDQIGKGFVHECLKLPAFALGKCAHGRKDLRINLSGEFLAGLGNGNTVS